MTRPAHETKHIRSLAYPHLGHTFHLTQSDDGQSNGTALWLGAQVLSLYVTSHPSLNLKPNQNRPRAVELGSGIGLTALVLSALGYDVLATDTPHVCNSVLRHNITANLPHLPATAGVIQVRELDWNVESDRWRWDDPLRITPSSGDHCGTTTEDLLRPPFDLIISSDTLYDVSLVQPFFRTVRALAATNDPVFLLALERRDPELIEDALGYAPALTRVPMKKIRKAMERAGVCWDASDWEGVEIWRGHVITSVV